MAKRPNLGQVTSTVFTVSQLNNAYEKIDTAFDNTLSRDGSTPNTMLADLDMNSNDILNVGTLDGDQINVNEAYIGGKLFTGTLTWRSDWATSTSYQELDLVKKDGVVYVCLEEHSSGTFSVDLAADKWEIFVEATGGGGGGVTDHGDLTGLSDDDHTQYHNDTRGDARYYTKSQVDTSLSGKANTSHTHVVADVTGLESRLDTGSTRISDDFVGNNTRGLLSGLKITSGRWNGAWRHRDVGDIIWYFTFSAMTLAPDMFTQDERKACVATALDKAVVGPRQNSSAYSQYTMVQFASGKIYFANIAGTSAGSAPSDAGVTTKGDFLGDGTITWEYTGLQAPTTWEWHILDVDTGLADVKFPDSHDAYVGMLAAATEAAAVDATWLATATAHPGFTRIQLIDQLITSNMTDQLNGTSPGPRLTYTFQDGVDSTGAAYTTRFLADNVEVWRGYRAQVYLRDTAGLSTTTAEQNAADVKSGCLGSDLFASGRFKAYVGRPDWDTITGNAVFVTDFRFHLWPAMHGMLSSVAEWQDYGDDVMTYTLANTPGIWTDSLDTLAIGEWFWAADRFFHLSEARETLLWRITSRNIANVTIVDACVAATDNDNGTLISSAAATDLTYTASTRVLASSTGTDTTLPLVSSGDAGLAPASGGGTSNFLRADGTWAAPPGGSSSTPYEVFEYSTDFHTTVADQVCQNFVSNGANTIVAWPFAGNPQGSGFVRQSLNATTGVRAAWGSANIAVANYLRQGVSLYRTFGSLMDLGASRVYQCNLGFVNDHTADPTYGCFFRYQNGVNSGKWEAVTVAGGSPTVADTGVTAVIDTMTIFEVEVNAAGTSVEFRIDGAVVATITTTIPSAAVTVGFTNSIRHVSGTAAITAALWDYQYVRQEFTGR